MTTPTNPLHIVELRASNVKRLRAVTIRPDADGNLVVLGGRNGQGKTSVLDAIAMALGGKEQIPSQPIRRGAEHAEVVVDLGEIVVRRTFTPSGGGQLVVSNRDGARFQSPQTMLDALVGKLTFDPLEFAREAPKRQAEVLRQLVGLDFADQDKQRAELYAERTAVNKQVAAARHRLDAMPTHDGAPAEPVAAGELAEQLRAIEEANRRLTALREQRDWAARLVSEARAAVEALREQLAEAEEHLSSKVGHLATLEAELEGREARDPSPLQQQLAEVDATNQKVRDNQRRAEAAAEVAAIEDSSTALTEQIQAIDQAKAAAITAAAMPIPGLGFSDAGEVTLDGIPLEQASGAERIRVSVAIGLAMNPRLRVLLIRDASLLDGHSFRMVAEMAQQAGAQVWLEMVEQNDHTTVLIEDGEAHEVAHSGASAAVGAETADAT